MHLNTLADTAGKNEGLHEHWWSLNLPVKVTDHVQHSNQSSMHACDFTMHADVMVGVLSSCSKYNQL